MRIFALRNRLIHKASQSILSSFTNKALINCSFVNISKTHFSTKEDDSGIDKDFQPQVKKTLDSENVIAQIDEWVKSNDVVLFMKGTREMPRCGFSNYLIQVIKFYKIKDFKDINVLESDVLRQGVKDYSNWPTFPQLYVKGELIGGCDIVKEMHENGTFEELCQRNNLI